MPIRSIAALTGVAIAVGLVLGPARVAPAAAPPAAPALVPRPASVTAIPCRAPLPLGPPLRVVRELDPGGLEEVRTRWRALGIPPPSVAGSGPPIVARRGLQGAEHYRLRVDDAGVTIESADAEGEFDALVTLAQLPVRAAQGWQIGCVAIDDRPALRWRIVSDDVSRGPLPTMRYFAERLRGLAAFKVNGYSPYMEQVVVAPSAPLVAPADGLTLDQLAALARIAKRYHMALVPEQQTFAHMHETLSWEQYAGLAELPHGYLLSPAEAGTYAYLAPLLRAELRAVGPQPFVHIGADEPLDLGRGRSAPLVAQEGLAKVFAGHVQRIAQIVAPFGARPMIWDDAVQKDPSILRLIPRSVVIVDFHYGKERTFAPYIATVARAGFTQMVSPGANNWNEIYPDIQLAFDNAAQFIADGKAAHVLGMFDTVWHDDGESLYEATWEPVAFAAASAWQAGPVDRARFPYDFARAFFGSDDPRYGADLEKLRTIRVRLRTPVESDPSDYLFWADPFDARIGDRVRAAIDLAAVRLDAEDVLAHLRFATPPLHANAARVMSLAALRYDTLARRFQIGAEAPAYYADARAHADGKHDAIVYRGLNVAKYLCWDLRDEMLAIEPRYRAAWLYESRPGALPRVLARYELAAQQAITDADRLDVAQREDYLREHELPPFYTVLDRPEPATPAPSPAVAPSPTATP